MAEAPESISTYLRPASIAVKQVKGHPTIGSRRSKNEAISPDSGRAVTESTGETGSLIENVISEGDEEIIPKAMEVGQIHRTSLAYGRPRTAVSFATLRESTVEGNKRRTGRVPLGRQPRGCRQLRSTQYGGHDETSVPDVGQTCE